MPYIRCQVSIASDTTIPADAAVNVYHFFSSSLSVAATVASADTKLRTFLAAVDGELAPSVLGSAVCKYYDLEDPAPRVPVDTQTVTLTPSAGTSAPSELAICISYASAPLSGVAPARRRGRIYFGPITTGSFSPSGGRIQVSSSVRTTLANAAAGLGGGNPATEAVWSVFSPTTAGPEPWTAGALGSGFFEIATGYVDDAFDIQRRRGTAPQNRTTWTA